MRTEYYVNVIEVATGECVKQVGPCHSQRSVEQVQDGMNINLNHEEYFLSVSTEEAAEATDVAGPMKCPECGYEPAGEYPAFPIRHVEKILATREVKGVNDSGEVIIESEYKVYDEDGEDQRFECTHCGQQFSMDGYDVQYV